MRTDTKSKRSKDEKRNTLRKELIKEGTIIQLRKRYNKVKEIQSAREVKTKEGFTLRKELIKEGTIIQLEKMKNKDMDALVQEHCFNW